jgi:hypothetical protein
MILTARTKYTYTTEDTDRTGRLRQLITHINIHELWFYVQPLIGVEAPTAVAIYCA